MRKSEKTNFLTMNLNGFCNFDKGTLQNLCYKFDFRVNSEDFLMLFHNIFVPRDPKIKASKFSKTYMPPPFSEAKTFKDKKPKFGRGVYDVVFLCFYISWFPRAGGNI